MVEAYPSHFVVRFGPNLAQRAYFDDHGLAMKRLTELPRGTATLTPLYEPKAGPQRLPAQP